MLSVNPSPRPTNGQPTATPEFNTKPPVALLDTTSTGHALRWTMRKYPLSWVMLGAIISDRTPWEIYFRFSVLASVAAGHGITRVRVLFACGES